MNGPVLRRSSALAALVTLVCTAAACGGRGEATPQPTGAGAPPTTSAPSPTAAGTTATPTSTSAPGSTTSTTLAPPEWQFTDLEFELFDVVVAGDRLWALTRTVTDEPFPMLLTSTDAVTWTQVPLTAAGVPVDGSTTIGSLVGDVVLAGSDAGLVAVVAAPVVDGLSAPSVAGDIYVVETVGSGTDMTVLGPSETGIDQRLGGLENFRFSSLSAAASDGDRVDVLTDAMWWRPFATTDSDLGVITRVGGAWTTASEDRDDRAETFDGGLVVQDGDRTVMAHVAGRGDGTAAKVLVATASDGAPFGEEVELPLIGAVPARIVLGGMTVLDGRLLLTGQLVSADRAVPTADVVWTSDDGIGWEVTAAPWTALLAPIRAGDVFFGIGRGADQSFTTWSSADGVKWTESRPPGRLPAARELVVLEDTLVAIVKNGVATYPLDAVTG